MKKEEDQPLLVGLRAARANLVPGLIIQVAMVATVLAYYFCSPVREWLARLAEVKRQGGYLFSLVSGMMTGGLLPELLTVSIFQRWRIRRENLSNLVFAMCFWGFMGVYVDSLYRAQAWLFGPQVDFATVAKKTIVDQLIITPFINIPLNVVAYEWKHQGYRFTGLPRAFSLHFYKQKILPTVVSGMGFWLPVVILVYSLPPLLQFPLFTLALALWVMIFTWISHAHKGLAP